jgi:DNA polymerase III alpha subunit
LTNFSSPASALPSSFLSRASTSASGSSSISGSFSGHLDGVLPGAPSDRALGKKFGNELNAHRSISVPYVELCARSCFSFLKGASHPEEMVKTAQELGYRGLALADTNGFYGLVRGWTAVTKPSLFDASDIAKQVTIESLPFDFQYICGAELTPFDAPPLTLIPLNKDGYQNLSRLITFAKRPAPKGAVLLQLNDILKNNDNLMAFPLPPWSETQIQRLQDAFGDRLYLPVCRDLTWAATTDAKQAFFFEKQYGIKLFATQRPLYHIADRKPLQDVLTCLLHSCKLTNANLHLTANRERFLKPPHEIAALFEDRPDLISNTSEIAQRVQFSLTELRYRYPQEKIPRGQSTSEHLRALVLDGIEWRYRASDINLPLNQAMNVTDTQSEKKSDIEILAKINPAGKLENRPVSRPVSQPGRAQQAQSNMPNCEAFISKVLKQVDHELSLIKELEYEDYFLTLHDICQFATSRSILYQGRGSAANSIVCFALGLTNVDPIKLNLLFERFISRERGEPPDIDIDFEHSRREEVIQYIYQKYGEEHAAMVCTTICYRSRMAVRDVGKVMGLSLQQVNALIRYMGREGLANLFKPGIDISQFQLTSAEFSRLIGLAASLHGFPRHLGIHTGGFVIAQEPITNIVPVEAASMDRRFVVQWNKNDIEALGMMKIDVLSLGMLTAIQKTLKLLKTQAGIEWNLAQIPHNDIETYQMIQKADTVGVFQIESRAQMSLLPRLKPKNYYDLVVEVAIVRPGPIQGGMVHPYLKRRSGQERVQYAHPALVPILSKTLGIPIFQEQIMQMVVAVAGFTPGEADELRRIMSSSWKKKTLMEGLRQRVINGMLNYGLSKQYADQIFKTIEGFSSYGFPESHAASFALITYASCYLKCHHPDLFTCALLNSQPMGFYSPRQLISDAQRHKVVFLDLDIQFSEWDYAPEQPLKLRVGFRSVYGFREIHAELISKSRALDGPFKNLSDFVKRTGLSKPSLLRLAAAGAFTSLNMSARESLWKIQSLVLDEDSFFFGHTTLSTPTAPDIENLPRESDWDSIQREYSTKGFSIDSHPLKILRPDLNHRKQTENITFVTGESLRRLKNGSSVCIAGLKSLMQKPPTAKGVCFVSLEDETGIFNVILMPDIYLKYRLTLMANSLFEIRGRVESRDGVINIKAHDLRPLTHSMANSLAVSSAELSTPPLPQPVALVSAQQ